MLADKDRVAAGKAAKLGLTNLLDPACPERDLALALDIARAVKPGSKLATRRWWVASRPKLPLP